MYTRKRLAIGATVVGVIVIVAAVAAAAVARHRATAARRAETPVQIAEEFRREAAGLLLAPHWIWPMNPRFPTRGPDGKPMMYEPGYGRTRADTLWFCSWAETYLAARPGSAEHASAARQLPKIFGRFFYRVALVRQDRPMFALIVKEAVRGRSGPLARYARLNCPRLVRRG